MANSIPNHLVLQLVSLSENVPWYDLMDLKLVSKEWKHAVDTTISYNSVWKQMVDFLNSENRLHECNSCHRPMANDGSTTDICESTLCTCGCGIPQTGFLGQFLVSYAAITSNDPRTLSIINPMLKNFCDIDASLQAYSLFRYHQATIKAIVECYQDMYIEGHFLDFIDEIHGEDYGTNLRYVKDRNTMAFRLMTKLVSLMVAKNCLKSRAGSLVFEMISEDHDVHFQNFVCAVEDEGLLSLVFGFERKVTNMLKLLHCDTAERLFGTKLAKSIDIHNNIREIMTLRKDEIFPKDWNATYCPSGVGFYSDEDEEANESDDDREYEIDDQHGDYLDNLVPSDSACERSGTNRLMDV